MTRNMQPTIKNKFPNFEWMQQMTTDQSSKKLQTAIAEFQYGELHQLE
jgi:hypothetical protein